MCPPCCHQNGFVATHALGHKMCIHDVPKGKPYIMWPNAGVETKPLSWQQARHIVFMTACIFCSSAHLSSCSSEIYLYNQKSKNYNKLSECISDRLERILFQLCVIILKISFLMKHHNFWSFSTIGKLVCKKNGHFKLQSNFSITFESVCRHKVN